MRAGAQPNIHCGRSDADHEFSFWALNILQIAIRRSLVIDDVRIIVPVRIAFITSSLEPGRDGVGDYTRRLAGELIRQGHESRLIALNDGQKAETGVRKSEFELQSLDDSQKLKSGKQKAERKEPISDFLERQESEGAAIECLRLPASLDWEQRIEMSRRFLDEFSPDWMSLQFVPFGFHRKGLCFGLGKRLAALNTKGSWQVMFHELWLGLGEKSSLKHRVLGVLQRLIILDLMRRLRPRLVHTQAEPYQKVLNREKIKASTLPLFSGIPHVTGDGWDDLLEPLVTNAVGKHQNQTKLYLAGVFGAVHPEWNAEQAVNTMLPLVQRFQKRLVLVFLGKNNLTTEATNKLKLTLKNRADVVIVGEKTSSEISRILQSLDFGLATSPRQIIQKSSSVATMLEHGLKMLVTRNDWRLRGAKSPLEEVSFRILSPEQFSLLETLPTRELKPTGDISVKRVADQMLKEIKSLTARELPS
jgi:hypothetical protein